MRRFINKNQTQEQNAASDPALSASILDLMLSLTGQTDPRVTFKQAADWLVRQEHVTLVVVYPYDPALNQLAAPITAGAKVPDLPTEMRLGTGVYGDVANNRRPLYIDQNKPGTRGLAFGMQSAYFLPMTHESQLLGVVGMQSASELAFNEQQRAAFDAEIKAISAQVAMTRRIANSQQAVARFDRFQILAQRLTDNLDTQALLQGVVEAAREMLDTQMSVLLEVREGEDELHPVAWSGITDETAALLKSRFKEDLKGLVAWARRPARTHNLLTDQRTARATQAIVAGMLSELAVPVMYRDTLYGTLAVETDIYRDFTDEEMNLLTSLAAQAGVALHNAQLFQVVQKTNRELEQTLEELALAHEAQIRAYEQELATARAIQESLLPQEDPPMPQIQLYARTLPARQVSGDFYQYFMLPDGRLGVAVGDVSGKGIPAALLMAVTTTAMRDEISRDPSPAPLLNALNVRLLARMKQNNMNSAMLMTVFDPQTRHVEIANAGMLQPYVIANGNFQEVAVSGYPLGASERMSYQSKTVTLAPGALLLFITDGVTECQNPDGEFFSYERLETLIKGLPDSTTAQQLVDLILDAVHSHAQEGEQSDDITVVAMKSI